ncbi:uncharacterized protein BO80DRAFT_292371 [Aspergillus ibericus CBS 121593]|uniref:Uncharacterized protein n=1 Tax=Aspergillus ibericus CBS 121593 TaxID=1448316 RepID=A0A395GHM0_9EURO|nr:hypothetical protein BO80DRAFT_292371 [Aspergillus ibericus CBS 121593]RAK94901.1 hypothetical protein BO80DRAFT_292371 [Aspergillus ibericus CBS 121593]
MAKPVPELCFHQLPSSDLYRRFHKTSMIIQPHRLECRHWIEKIVSFWIRVLCFTSPLTRVTKRAVSLLKISGLASTGPLAQVCRMPDAKEVVGLSDEIFLQVFTLRGLYNEGDAIRNFPPSAASSNISPKVRETNAHHTSFQVADFDTQWMSIWPRAGWAVVGMASMSYNSGKTSSTMTNTRMPRKPIPNEWKPRPSIYPIVNRSVANIAYLVSSHNRAFSLPVPPDSREQVPTAYVRSEGSTRYYLDTAWLTQPRKYLTSH